MGSSSSNSGDMTISIRPPDYVMPFHENFLTEVVAQIEGSIGASPYVDFTYDNIDEDFFGIGYLISSYASLYDMFGKFMAGLDLESLWKDSAIAILTPSEIHAYAIEEKRKLDDRIDMETLPMYQRIMRDLNAVGSSSFVIGCTNIEDERVKEFAKISLDATTKLLVKAEDKFITELGWCRDMIGNYAKIMKKYFSYRIDTDTKRYTLLAEDVLWPFTVLDYERRALNALGPQWLENNQDKVDNWYEKNKTLVGAVSILMWTIQGAYIGSSYPPYGTVIGAVIGFVIGVALYFLD